MAQIRTQEGSALPRRGRPNAPAPVLIIAALVFLALFVAWGFLYNWFLSTWGQNNDLALGLATAFFWVLALAIVVVAVMWTRTVFAGWQTRDLLLVAVVGAAFGPLFLVWNTVYGWTGALGPWQNLIGGFWWIPVILVPYIIRKPGAALVAEIIASVIETLLGSQYGVVGAAVGGLVQGMGAEVIFMLTGWRRYDWVTLSIAGVASAVTGFVYYLPIYYAGYDLPYLAATLAAYVIGVLVFAVLGTKLIVDALLPTGVLDGFAIGRERRAKQRAEEF